MARKAGSADMPERARQPHAALERDSRVPKARKIINLLGAERFGRARSLLEIGCGAGVITSILAQEGGGHLDVHAVDVVDTRVETEGYRFCQVSGTRLPYADGQFDIVISNHVIEHVGDSSDQQEHLREIHRVLADGGVAYLAVPNRWRFVEPHFHLPLLSWLPRPWCDHYVRLAARGAHYDCNPPSHSRALSLFASAGFRVQAATMDAIRETLALESGPVVARAFDRWVPGFVAGMLMPVMPTYVFLLSRQSGCDA